MLYKVTNTGEARTVDFLAVFAEGETKTFSQDELKMCQQMSGVDINELLKHHGFDIEKLGDAEDTREADALAQQEKDVAKLNAAAVPGKTVRKEAK
jgi:hypothetical protein